MITAEPNVIVSLLEFQAPNISFPLPPVGPDDVLDMQHDIG